MLKYKNTFSSYSVDDPGKANAFYSEILDLDVQVEDEMGLKLNLAGGSTVFLYPKKNHDPAGFTVLNFSVEDIDAAMDHLKEKGVQFIHYNRADLPQDEKGVLRGLKAGMGPDIAWFEDPAGNILSILQED